MKKIVIGVITLVAVVFGGGYFLAFTQSGNNILLPFINSYLKSKVTAADIKIDSLTLKPDHITAKANINQMADINLDGDFDALKQSFDMTYTLNAKKIETKEFKFDEKIYIKGKASGDLKKALIFGVGKIANSDIKYKLDLIDKNPKNITARIDKAELKKLLLLAGQKPYADGIVTLVVNIPSIDEKNLNGDAKLIVFNGKIDQNIIKKEFQVDLPKGTTFAINSDIFLKKDTLISKHELSSSLASLNIPIATYNLKASTLNADYKLNIPDLSRLKSLTKMALKGDFKAHGKLKLKDKTLQASLISSSLGGKTEAYLVGDSLKALLKGISTNAIFYKLNLPKYTDAKIDADITLKSIKNLLGEFKISANGINKRAILKKMYDFDPGRDIKYTLLTNGRIKNNKIYASTDIKNSFGDIKLKESIFDIKSGILKTPYTIYIDDLSKLNYITKQKLVGDLKAEGTITKDKTLQIDGKIKKFDGDITYKLVGDKLTAKVKDATLTKIQKTISYPAMLEAKAFADLNYNLSTSKGRAVINMKEAKMLPNKLTNILKSLGGTDLTAQHYNDTKLIADLSKNLILFDFVARTKNDQILLNIKRGKILQPKGILDAKLNIKVKKDRLSLKISGTTTNPKIRLSGSSIEDNLKQKAKEKAKAKLEEAKKKAKEKLENKIKEKLKIDSGAAKDLLKKLF